MESWEPISSGVTQGSILGPMLFKSCIDDVGDGLVDFIDKFADDIKIGNSVFSECDSFRKYLQKILTWSDWWGMPFNT